MLWRHVGDCPERADHAIMVTVRCDLNHGFAYVEDVASAKSGAGMKCIGKFAAVVLSMAIFAMPAAAMPLHCLLMAPSGANAHPCPMMGMDSSSDNIKAAPSDRSCCEVAAARPQPFTVSQAPVTNSFAPAASQALLSDLPAAPVAHGPFDWIAQLPGAPPQAVLCTFLI